MLADRIPETTAISCQNASREPLLLPATGRWPPSSLGKMTTSVKPAMSSSEPMMRLVPKGMTLAPNQPKWSISRLKISWLNIGMIKACNCPISLNRWMAMVMVTTATIPTNQLQHGASASISWVGRMGIPASSDTSSSASVETEKETSVET